MIASKNMKVNTETNLSERLIQLLNESHESITNREKTTFDRITKNKRDVLIFGAGNVGRKALLALRSNGYNVLGFIDNNAKLHGAKIDQINVYSPQNAFNK